MNFELIRSRRKELKLTLADVASEVGVTQSYLSQIEAGKKTPKESVIQAINRALGLDLTTEEADGNSTEDETTFKKKFRTGFSMELHIGVTKTTFKVNTDIRELEQDKEDIDEDEIKSRYRFESDVIVKSLSEFLKENESELKERIISNLREEAEKLRSLY